MQRELCNTPHQCRKHSTYNVQHIMSGCSSHHFLDIASLVVCRCFHKRLPQFLRCRRCCSHDGCVAVVEFCFEFSFDDCNEDRWCEEQKVRCFLKRLQQIRLESCGLVYLVALLIANKFGVDAFLGKQLFVCALLNDLASIS